MSLIGMAALILRLSLYAWLVVSSIVTILIAIVYYFLRPKPHVAVPNEPPFVESYTALGPIEMLLDPLRFIRDTNKALGTNDTPATSFSTTMLGSYAVFISDPEDVKMVTSKGMEEVCNFPEPYEGAIRSRFGRMILSKETFHAQLQLLKDNLNTSDLKRYLEPSVKLAQQIVERFTPDPSGEVNLTDLARTVVFSNAIQNFLGKDLLTSSASFLYEKTFDSFDLVKQAFPIMFPNVHGFYQRHLKKRDDFDMAVMKLVEKREQQERKKPATQTPPADTATTPEPVHYENVLDELIQRRREKGKGSLTWGCTAVLINLVKFFVFGTGFNTFNFVVYVFFWLIEQPRAVWDELRQEQLDLDDKYGPEMSFKKLEEMKKLRAVVSQQMALNCFPLLLRAVKKDFKLKNGQVVSKGAIVAFSPRMQCEIGVLDIVFGSGAHPCPAEWYSWNSILIALSSSLKRFAVTKVIKAKKPENKRLITFPNLPPVIVNYVRVNL